MTLPSHSDAIPVTPDVEAENRRLREVLERIATEALSRDEMSVLANMAVRGAEFHA